VEHDQMLFVGKRSRDLSVKRYLWLSGRLQRAQ
jgi:hypothetical protein